MSASEETREKEWWVPAVGPRRFRLLVGLSFYPYSFMNASYILVGSLLAPSTHYDRMIWMAAAYLLAVGVTSHSLDAIAPNKPWGSLLSRGQLTGLAVGALVPALAIGLYFALTVAPLLLLLGSLELFFLFAYNLELFHGAFHSDFWFAVSWGFLPVMVGYVVQTDSVSPAALAGGFFGFFTAFIEITASRPYKILRKGHGDEIIASRLESILKGIVATVLSTAAFLLAYSLLR